MLCYLLISFTFQWFGDFISIWFFSFPRMVTKKFCIPQHWQLEFYNGACLCKSSSNTNCLLSFRWLTSTLKFLLFRKCTLTWVGQISPNSTQYSERTSTVCILMWSFLILFIWICLTLPLDNLTSYKWGLILSSISPGPVRLVYSLLVESGISKYTKSSFWNSILQQWLKQQA